VGAVSQALRPGYNSTEHIIDSESDISNHFQVACWTLGCVQNDVRHRDCRSSVISAPGVRRVPLFLCVLSFENSARLQVIHTGSASRHVPASQANSNIPYLHKLACVCDMLRAMIALWKCRPAQSLRFGHRGVARPTTDPSVPSFCQSGPCGAV
jgi:hypothetical protein